ncbi:MAG: gamma-glutamyl-gamma-aminobutyrate hydrolase family protein [Capsulimonadaceae bacterium]|nr:gamma-glutamyl-gamma-aminobutyrate hydrolase family protein [Capsulimonadaceae bacterium]
MSKPIIVISSGRINRGAAEGDLQRIVLGLNSEYVESVVQAGGAPVILPRHSNLEAVRDAVEMADGLILTGGGDIASITYEREPHPTMLGQDIVRDEAEIAATQIAIGRDIPVLGICRGLQLINVALGGTLMQDIASQIGSEIQHKTHSTAPGVVHTIDIEPASTLANLHNAIVLQVNSEHHQAIERLGDGLRVTARARDAVVEAIEFADGKPLLAVQYHPEDLAQNDPRFRLYFNWIVTKALEYKARKTVKTKPTNGHKIV